MQFLGMIFVVLFALISFQSVVLACINNGDGCQPDGRQVIFSTNKHCFLVNPHLFIIHKCRCVFRVILLQLIYTPPFKMQFLGMIFVVLFALISFQSVVLACINNGDGCQPDGRQGNCCSGYCHKEPGWAAGYCR
ncbi:unnamed protein product [Brassicogethes aeneus]|uniref:Uncharacterized protein n=1 Tax=Brassicogethes aeneus TaxID=1431903 RepID=A0A9P0FNR7_BRAAE|nr:unnamed protein product [Brassicogethes aeneus]